MKCIKKNYWKLAAINFNHIYISSTYLCTYLSNLYVYIYLKHREKKEKSTAIYFLKFADLIEILQQMIFALWALQTLMLIVCPTILHFTMWGLSVL